MIIKGRLSAQFILVVVIVVLWSQACSVSIHIIPPLQTKQEQITCVLQGDLTRGTAWDLSVSDCVLLFHSMEQIASCSHCHG